MRVLVPLFLLSVSPCSALFKDEAGKLDFLIATAGHGPTQFAQIVSGGLITSDAAESNSSGDATSSCYVANRNLEDGSLNWRRNVCSSRAEAQRHVLTVGGSGEGEEIVATLDASGSVRGWSVDSGALLWDVVIPTSGKSNAKLSISAGTGKDSKDYIVAAAGGGSVVLDAATGESADTSDVSSTPAPKLSSEAFCSEASTLVDVQEEGSLVAWRSNGPGNRQDRLAESEAFVSPGDSVTMVSMLSCSATAVSVLLSTTRGSTAHVTFSSVDKAAQVQTLWKVEEGLAQVSSAIVLDASHYVGDLKDTEEVQLLQFSNRLQAQWDDVVSFFSSSDSPAAAAAAVGGHRDHTFGFVKLAVLLSSSAHRIFGMATSGADRGVIRYQLDLPPAAQWHRLVHGTATGSSGAVMGLNGASHNREVLALSAGSENQLDWSCFDGSSGAVHADGSLSLPSSIVQVVPLVATGGSCRQGALVLTQDGSLHAVPADASFDKHIQASPNGLYTHAVDKDSGKVTALRIVGTAGGLKSTTMGTATFPGEEIISVAYPTREEVVQSPCNVLGDDSLLLKYLNPHLAVFITKTSSSSSPDDDNEFAKALQSAKTAAGKRKPAGVTTATDGGSNVAEGETSPPNLFVNLVDTASGRILYRISHCRAVLHPPPKAIISENWVYYTYMNERTRRAEVGVLSLYEGMIDSKGLTAFTSPDQTATFSSFDARNAKPVVLAKTFSLAKPATALSMTVSRGGISGRRLLLATMDGQITAVDRKVVDPRRPIGQVKDSEKKEGLHQYSELIPTVSYMSLSYNQTVEAVTSIVAAPTYLESQSLILAFGGPDIFFARNSPSRGFDLLPDSFNRVLLSIVVLAIMVVLVVTHGMVNKKMKKQGWT